MNETICQAGLPDVRYDLCKEEHYRETCDRMLAAPPAHRSVVYMCDVTHHNTPGWVVEIYK